MHATKLTSKYQLTLPKEVRQLLHVGQGDFVEFIIQGDKVILKKPSPIDWQYLSVLQGTLQEWESDEDEAAYRDL